jgi:glycine/D-amino acid oxidase-like deaminating enzyme
VTRDLPARTDLVVIGGGILGTLTALLVARAGVDVVLLERGAMFREASGVNAGGLAIQTTVPDITPDAVASVATWSRLADDLGADVGFVRTGGFRVATSEKEVAELLEAMPRLAALGLTMQWHGGNEIRHNLPWLGSGIMGASYCAEEAFAVPMLAGAALKNAALGAGARVHEHTAVTGLTPVGKLVQVRTAGGDITARRVLIAGGAWIASIARMLGVEIPLLLKTFMLTVTERAPPIMGQLVTHARRNLTMKQFRNGTCVIGGGWPGVGSVSPVRKDIDVDVLARNLRHALSVVPRLGDVPVARSWAGLEGATADELPLMGALPGHPNVFVLGCVRGGFVLGPRLAPLMADVLLGRAAAAPPAFDPGRFSRANVAGAPVDAMVH